MLIPAEAKVRDGSELGKCKIHDISADPEVHDDSAPPPMQPDQRLCPASSLYTSTVRRHAGTAEWVDSGLRGDLVRHGGLHSSGQRRRREEAGGISDLGRRARDI